MIFFVCRAQRKLVRYREHNPAPHIQIDKLIDTDKQVHTYTHREPLLS